VGTLPWSSLLKIPLCTALGLALLGESHHFARTIIATLATEDKPPVPCKTVGGCVDVCTIVPDARLWRCHP